MAFKRRVHPELIVSRYNDLIRWVKSIDPLLPSYLENKYYYAKLGLEFGYQPETVRRILLYEIHGVDYKKRKKGGRK